MDDSNLEEAPSPDIWKPRYLFRRYDSASGSSGSNNSSLSSNSIGSFQQCRRGQRDGTTQRSRRRTISSTLSESRRNGENSISLGASCKTRGRPNDTANATLNDESVDDEDACIFCSSMVYERQYYLWQSQYTKSSLCSRCTNDNEGMRYISFWGTPSYEMGSWRKRYRAGRSLDIDLSPLLEVLEKIDNIDTSMYGRKSLLNTAKCGNQIKHTDSESFVETFETKESEEMSSRRRRRQENRKIVENPSEPDDRITNNQCLNQLPNHQDISECSDRKRSDTLSARRRKRLENRKAMDNLNGADDQAIHQSRYRLPDQKLSRNNVHCCNVEDSDENELRRSEEVKYDENNNNKTDTEFLVFETTQKIEQVDIIEPLYLLTAEEQIPTDLVEDNTTPEYPRVNKSNKAQTSQRPEEFSSPENISKYVKERRKSNYEDFIAGLEPASPLKRRSTADKDLTVNLQRAQKKVHKKKEHSMPSNKKWISKSESTSDSDMTGSFEEMYNKDTQDKLRHYYKNKRNSELYAQKTERCNKKTATDKNDKIERRNNHRSCTAEGEPVKDIVKIRHDPENLENMSARSQIVKRRRRPKQLTRKKNFVVGSSSSNEECEEATFSDIKRRFENLCHGETKQSRRSSNSKQSTKISKGYFRSQYLDMSSIQQRSDYTDSEQFESDGNNNNIDYSGDDGEDKYDIIASVEDDNNSDKRDNDVNLRNLNREKLSDQTSTSESTKVCTTGTIKDENTKDCINGKKSTSLEVNKKTHNKNICAKQDYDDCCENLDQDESFNSETKCLNIQEEERATITDKSSKQIGNNTSLNSVNSEHSKTSIRSNNDLSQIEEIGRLVINKDSRSDSESSTYTDDLLKNNNDLFDSKYLKKNDRDLNARAREKKYKQIANEAEDDNPDIERIKKKLGRKPKYEEEDSDVDEMNDTIMELNGSDDEEVELCWRTRGYDKDFYMSRRSVTGGEILDRYNRAISNRRSKHPRRKTKGTAQSNLVDKIMTQSEPISRGESRTGKYVSSHSAPLTRTSTLSKLTHGNESENYFKDKGIEDTNDVGGVSAVALKAALNRAAFCSKRMSQRLEHQLRQSDSSSSSS